MDIIVGDLKSYFTPEALSLTNSLDKFLKLDSKGSSVFINLLIQIINENQ